MYKILNKLFGWDYVLFKDPQWLNRNCISSVSKTPNGDIVVRDSCEDITLLKRMRDVTWLTCKPEKYEDRK